MGEFVSQEDGVGEWYDFVAAAARAGAHFVAYFGEEAGNGPKEVLEAHDVALSCWLGGVVWSWMRVFGMVCCLVPACGRKRKRKLG